jgi:hypothetical protein
MKRLIAPPLPAASRPSKRITTRCPVSLTQACSFSSSTCRRYFCARSSPRHQVACRGSRPRASRAPVHSRQSLSPRTRPWREVSAAALRQVRGVMTDIDDTLTAEGRLDPSAADALAALHTAGVPVVAITGRPMGWSEDFVRPGPGAWPVRRSSPRTAPWRCCPRRRGAGRVRAGRRHPRAQRTPGCAVQQRILAEVPGATAGTRQRRPRDRHRDRPFGVRAPGRSCHRAGGGHDAGRPA